ncbi:unnamed protein product [Closterium sp. Naga37s-1]|nr:unnamed protein product [Closterium sp. Naga37s-1]
MASLEVLAYTFGVLAVVLFGAGACAFAVYREMKQGGPDTPDFFLTARKSVPMLTIAWSFYAGAMGSWALFGPPSYCSYAGTLGMIMYSISAGLPIIIVAWFGAVIHRLVPSVVSMADYVRRRFGLVISLYVSALMLFNMGVAITAEYTAVGSLFTDIIGSKSLPIILVIGLVSLTYTAIGGLYVSIITDQWQAGISVVLVLFIFVCIFAHPTRFPSPFPCPDSHLPHTQAGISVVFVLVLFIFVCATFDAPLGPLPSEPVDLTWSNEFGLASIALLGVIEPQGAAGGSSAAPSGRPLSSAAVCSSPPPLRRTPPPPAAGRHQVARRCWGEQRWRQWPSQLLSSSSALEVSSLLLSPASSLVVPSLLSPFSLLAFPLLAPCLPVLLPAFLNALRLFAAAAALSALWFPFLPHSLLTPFLRLLAVWGGVRQPNEEFTNTNTILFSLFNLSTATPSLPAPLPLSLPFPSTCNRPTRRVGRGVAAERGFHQHQHHPLLALQQHHVDPGHRHRARCRHVRVRPLWFPCLCPSPFPPLPLPLSLFPSPSPTLPPSLMAGLLAVWGGVWQPNEDFTNTNTILFSLFNDTTWILVIATVLAVVMSESAVDSLQNAIADTLTTAFLAIIDFFLSVSSGPVEAAVTKTAFMAVFESKGIWAIRAIVLLFNIPPLVVALKGYNVLQLFLLANLLTTTSVIPVMAGVIPGKWSRRVITPFSVGFGCLSGIASLFIWTQIYSVKNDMSYSDSLYQVFLYAYDYPPFLMALGFSVAGMVVGAGCEAVARVVLKKEYPEFDLGSEELPEVQSGEMVDAGMEKLGMGDGDSAASTCHHCSAHPHTSSLQRASAHVITVARIRTRHHCSAHPHTSSLQRASAHVITAARIRTRHHCSAHPHTSSSSDASYLRRLGGRRISSHSTSLRAVQGRSGVEAMGIREGKRGGGGGGEREGAEVGGGKGGREWGHTDLPPHVAAQCRVGR